MSLESESNDIGGLKFWLKPGTFLSEAKVYSKESPDAKLYYYTGALVLEIARAAPYLLVAGGLCYLAKESF